MQHRGAVTASLALTGAGLHRKRKAAVSFFSRVSEKQEDGSLPMWAKGSFSPFTFSHTGSNSSLPFSEELFQFISLLLFQARGN